MLYNQGVEGVPISLSCAWSNMVGWTIQAEKQTNQIYINVNTGYGGSTSDNAYRLGAHTTNQIDITNYSKFIVEFNSVAFNPTYWLALAIGKYVTISGGKDYSITQPTTQIAILSGNGKFSKSNFYGELDISSYTGNYYLAAHGMSRYDSSSYYTTIAIKSMRLE